MDISHEDRGRSAREAYKKSSRAPQRIREIISRVLTAHPAEGIDQSLAMGAACTGGREDWIAEVKLQRQLLAGIREGDL